MPDALDTHMTRLWGDFAEGVAAGLVLCKGHRLQDVLPVSTSLTTTPYRTATAWRAPGAAALQQVKAEVTERAYRFHVTRAVDIDAGSTTSEEARQIGSHLGKHGGRGETREVLGLLTGARRPFTTAAVQKAADRLGEGCRLLRAHPIPAQVAVPGTVDLVVVPPDVLPQGVRVVLVAGTRGPSVERLGDALALTWTRASARSAALTLTSDFFVRSRDRSAFFV